MRDKWTEEDILNLIASVPRNTRKDIREGTGDGFAIAVYESGNASFIYFYHYKGRKRRMNLGKFPRVSLYKARQRHFQAMKILADGEDPAIVKLTHSHK